MLITSRTTTLQTWRPWAALILLGLPQFMMATDFTAIFLAIPDVGADLAPSTTQMLWIVHIGELISAGTLITMGWLTTRIGPRCLILMALALYGSASAIAAFAPNAETLLVARVLIGAATAAVIPAGYTLLRSLFTSARHYGIAFAVMMGAFPVGAALGPPITGFLLEYFSWGAVFLVNIPVAVVALLGGFWLFPGTTERTSDRLDIISVIVSMAAVMLVVFGLQELADQGFSARYLLSVGVGIGLGAWFIRRQRRINNPLLDLDLFAIRILRLLTIFFFLSMGFMAVDFVLIQHLQIVLDVAPSALGMILVAPGIAAILSTWLTPILTRRFTPATVMVAGLGVSLLGAIVILIALLMIPVSVVFAVGMTLIAFGMSPPIVLGAQLMLTSVSKQQTGPAASIQDMSASIGAVVGIMVLGSLSMAMFTRGVYAGAPDGIANNDLAVATENPGAAIALADAIGGHAGETLQAVIYESWSWGTVAAYLAVSLLGVVMIIMIARGLRGVELPSDDSVEATASGS